MAIPSHPTIRPSASRICLPGTNISRRLGFSCIAARAVIADTTRRVSSFSSGRSITCPNVVRNTGISPYGVTSVRMTSEVSDTRATPALLISLPPTTSVCTIQCSRIVGGTIILNTKPVGGIFYHGIEVPTASVKSRLYIPSPLSHSA